MQAHTTEEYPSFAGGHDGSHVSTPWSYALRQLSRISVGCPWGPWGLSSLAQQKGQASDTLAASCLIISGHPTRQLPA